ncbi:MAG: hypothetical protein IKH15_09210 [Bacteroidales bacterium]|nr:hypothetical protein [Bacteroidales bacterium]
MLTIVSMSCQVISEQPPGFFDLDFPANRLPLCGHSDLEIARQSLAALLGDGVDALADDPDLPLVPQVGDPPADRCPFDSQTSCDLHAGVALGVRGLE